jgi:hypothetical protein
VSVVSLATHKYVPIGRNAQGQPVYSIYSNGKGGYTIYPEAPADENLVVVASAPGTRARAASYSALAAPGAATAAQLDDTTTVGVALLRTAFAGQIRTLAQDTTPPGVRPCQQTAAEQAIFGVLGFDWIDKVRANAQAARTWALTDVAAKQVSLEAVDGMMARLELAKTTTVPNLTRTVVPEAADLQPEGVLDATSQAFDELEAAARERLAKEPDAFARTGPHAAELARLYRFIDYYKDRYDLPEPQIRRPADLGAYCVGKLLWLPDPKAPDLVADLMAVAGVAKPQRALRRVLGVATGVELELAKHIDEGNYRQHILDVVLAAKDRPHRDNAPTPTPFPSGTCAPDRTSPLE